MYIQFPLDRKLLHDPNSLYIPNEIMLSVYFDFFLSLKAMVK